MTDPRDLIQRLIAAVRESDDWILYRETLPVVAEAEAWLATPEPAAWPTLDDILELCAEHEFMLGIDGANEDESAKGLLEIARAVLARWGHQPPQPISLSDRLPGPEDCDAEGRCWWWIVEQPGQFPHWIYAPREVVSWAGYLAWLPHHALPLPEVS